MIWSIALSRQAEKFLEKNGVPSRDVFELVQSALKKFQGENITWSQ